MTKIHRFRFLVASLIIFVAVGCGGSAGGSKIEGKLVDGSSPCKSEEGQTLNLSLTTKEGQAYPAKLNAADGSFEIDGPDGKGVPAGTYKVNVNITSSASDPASLERMATINKKFEKLKDKEIEITNKPTPITIDISTGTVTK